MSIPKDILLKVQNTLRDLVRDDWTCAKMVFWLKGSIEHQNTPNDPRMISAWQASIDFIFRCFSAGLIEIINHDHYSDQNALLDDLRSCNPFDRSAGVRAGDYAWNGIFICGTESLDLIVKRFFQNDDEDATNVNGSFVAAIEGVFEEAGVPWSGKPLLPVFSSPTSPAQR